MMKTAYRILKCSLCALLVTLPVTAQRPSRELLSLKTVLEKEYSWNASSGAWQLSSKIDYSYNAEGEQINLVKYDAITSDSISKVDYSYTPESLLSYYIVSLWNDEGWGPDTKYSYTYTSAGKASQRILRWNGTEWNATKLDTLFQYDINGLLIQSENYRWKDNEWLKDHTIYYEYSPTGKLTRKYSISEAGVYLSQVLYSYDSYDRLSEMLAQFYNDGRWDNGWRKLYSYDKCSVLKTMVRQEWGDGNWGNTLMSEFEHTLFWGGQTNGKVNICHNGHSITVPVNVLEIFLLQGDCIGICEGELLQGAEDNPDGQDGTEMNDVYSVFPNPASEQVTVISASGLTLINRVDLISVKGELMRSFRYDNIPEVTIYVGDLKPGRYYVVISGDIAWSSSLIVN